MAWPVRDTRSPVRASNKVVVVLNSSGVVPALSSTTTIHRSLPDFRAADRPAPFEPRRPHRRRPGRPCRGLQRKGTGQMIHGLLDRVSQVGRPSIRRRVTRRRPGAAERLVVHERVPAPMHRDEQVPLLARASLRDHAAHGMADVAGPLGIRVFVFVVDDPALSLKGGRPGLFRRETEVIGQIFDDLARGRRLNTQPIECHHPPDGLLPPFGRVAPEGDPGNLLLVVHRVTWRARLLHDGIRNRDSLFGFGLRRCRWRRCRRCGLLADNRRPGGNHPKKDDGYHQFRKSCHMLLPSQRDGPPRSIP